MPPPITQAICSTVSDQAKTRVRTDSSMSRWTTASLLSLMSWAPSPATRPRTSSVVSE